MCVSACYGGVCAGGGGGGGGVCVCVCMCVCVCVCVYVCNTLKVSDFTCHYKRIRS